MYPQPYQHLLAFLDSNPQYLHDMRVRLLSPDLIALPEQFAQLVSLVTDLVEGFNTFADTTDRRLTALENAVATLQGSDIERRTRDSILNIAKDELNLTRGQILLARGRDTEPQFLATLDIAEDHGLITEQQADIILVADIIIRARRQNDRQYVHAVFEVSRTIRNHDIQRAHYRAAAVAAATSEEAIPAVIGEVIQPPQRAQADEMGVRALIPAMFSADEATNA